MQTKMIKKTISSKMEAWLSSITDEMLRKDVKKNLLVSGGSIASLLQGQPVNDYDVYIQDMAVLVRLAEYYLPGKVLDGRLRNAYLETEFPEAVKNGGVFNDGVEMMCRRWVCLSNLKTNQVKMDVPSEGLRFEKEGQRPYQLAFISQNAISLTDDIQIVTRFNGSVEEIHKTFDFIHATNYFTFKEGLVLNLDAVTSILTKQLKYQGSLYPLTSIIRLKKFLLRGWKVNAGEMLKIMFQISELDLKNINVLEEQLIGVDIAYFSTLISVLRGSKVESFSSEYISSIIDKIFNDYDEENETVKQDNDK